MKPFRVGISTCPNDTFAFHHLMERTGEGGDGSVEWVLDDVQALNERMARGELDCSKVSYAAATRLSDDLVLLPVGGALGFGVGPVVLAASGDAPEPQDARVLTPGEDTTAHLLWRVFHPESRAVEHRVFSAIPAALRAGEADLGVCIHEARFTYRQQGLVLWGDLGVVWEQVTGLPLPLGGLAARAELVRRDVGRLAAFVRDARASVRAALAEPEACLPTMRRWAQEFDDRVLLQHAELYVNEWTVDLGLEGRAALHELFERARAARFTTRTRPPAVFEEDGGA